MSINAKLRKFIPKSLISLYHLFYAWYGAFKYRHPSEELLVIGITGTTGKSSTVYWLRQLLECAGFKVGSLSTIDFYVNGEDQLNDKKMTMLGKMEIQRYLRKMVDAKCDVAIVEMTSEGEVQHRNKFINVDIMILTGLYPEHIESHGSFENYKAAKLRLFSYVAKSKRKVLDNSKFAKLKNSCCNEIVKTALVNGNCEYASQFLSGIFENKFVFLDENKDVRVKFTDVDAVFALKNIVQTVNGLSFSLSGMDFMPKIYGSYNAMNLAIVISVSTILGIDKQKIISAVNSLRGVPGRIEFIPEAEKYGFKAIVDYAFEPVALEALYNVVELLKPARVLHVAGATGGGRDKARRIPIGRILGQKADFVFVTDEDPYDEDPMEIIKTVSRGAVEAGKKLGENLWEILDRKIAIQTAVKMSQPGDLVLVTGKGSEQAMCIMGGKLLPWDDREVVREAIEKKN